MAEEDRGTGTIAWKMRVPIFRDRTILTQLSIAIGIPFTLLFVICSSSRWRRHASGSRSSLGRFI